MKEALAVGLMSGTSLDGVSTALVRLTNDPPSAKLLAFRQEPYTAAERGAIIDAMARGTPKDLAFLHVALGERFAGAVLALLAQARVAPKDLSFVASHGQTIWHEPGRATLQLGDAAVLAERLGVRVVSDFRARDVAAGGARRKKPSRSHSSATKLYRGKPEIFPRRQGRADREFWDTSPPHEGEDTCSVQLYTSPSA